jgi:4'-phosphopantetheinyl transferase
MISDSGFQISECPGGQIWNLKSGVWGLLCITQTSEQIPPNNDWLSSEERRVAEGFRFPKRRADWRLGRWTAKRAICAFLNLDNSVLPLLEIRTASDGAPEAYFDEAPMDALISISHSRNRGFCLAGPKRLAAGCDLEWVEPREKNFAPDYFAPEEVDFVAHAEGNRDIAETLIWCAKEAALKVVRKGLTVDTRSVIIRPDYLEPMDSWQCWTGECPESSMRFRGLWQFCDGFIYTVAMF